MTLSRPGRPESKCRQGPEPQLHRGARTSQAPCSEEHTAASDNKHPTHLIILSLVNLFTSWRRKPRAGSLAAAEVKRGPRGVRGLPGSAGTPRDVRVCFQVRSQGLLPVQRSGSTSSSEISVQLRAHRRHFPTEKVRQKRGRKCRGYFIIPVSKKKTEKAFLILAIIPPK